MKEISYTYFQNKNISAMMTGYQKGDPLKVAYQGVLEVKPDADEHYVCEVLYGIFNNDNRPDGKVQRSMSVGDVILLPFLNKALAVDMVGFKEVDEDYLP